MNSDIEIVTPDFTEYVPVADFKKRVKKTGAKLKVVGEHYRWVRENEAGELFLMLPKDE